MMSLAEAASPPPHIAQLVLDAERARLALLDPSNERLDRLALRLVGSGKLGAHQVLLEMGAEFATDLSRAYPQAPFAACMAHAARQLSRVFDRAASWERPGSA